MKINTLNQRTDLDNHAKLKETFGQFEKLLFELQKRDLPNALAISINKDIEEINATASSENDFLKVIKRKLTGILKLLEKEVKWVPKNYYRNLWIAFGMSVFGIPLGVAFGASLGSMAYLGIGLPIGLAIGIAVGSGMDKKAFEEGRQLDVEIKS